MWDLYNVRQEIYMMEKDCRTAQNWNLRGECLTIPTLTLYVTKPQAFPCSF